MLLLVIVLLLLFGAAEFYGYRGGYYGGRGLGQGGLCSSPGWSFC